MCLRFFGDDAKFRPLPTVKPDYIHDVRDNSGGEAPIYGHLKAGDPFRSPLYLQLR